MYPAVVPLNFGLFSFYMQDDEVPGHSGVFSSCGTIFWEYSVGLPVFSSYY